MRSRQPSPRRRHRRRSTVLLALCALLVSACSAAPEAATVERPAWADRFASHGVVGTMAVRRVGESTTYVHDPDRAAERRRPASTFKVLNALIILETGVVADVDTTVAWDEVDRSLDVWNQDHSLRTGIEVSAVWLFQAMAREVGEVAMAEHVAAAQYGNADIGGAIDSFWLDGELRISALEQLDFLEALAAGDLPFRPDVTDAVGEILVREEGEGWQWLHKTGTALSEDPDLGWLVGITRKGDDAWVFALAVDLEPVDDLGPQIDPAVRVALARELLVEAGALPPRPESEGDDG